MRRGLLLVVLLAAGCTSSGELTLDNKPSTHEIIYYLTGTASSADLTLDLGSGGQSQQQGVSLPLTNKSGTAGLRFTATDGQFLYISAQNNGSGTMCCRIMEDGREISSNDSDGEFAIVTCEGTA